MPVREAASGALAPGERVCWWGWGQGTVQKTTYICDQMEVTGHREKNYCFLLMKRIKLKYDPTGPCVLGAPRTCRCRGLRWKLPCPFIFHSPAPLGTVTSPFYSWENSGLGTLSGLVETTQLRRAGTTEPRSAKSRARVYKQGVCLPQVWRPSTRRAYAVLSLQVGWAEDLEFKDYCANWTLLGCDSIFVQEFVWPETPWSSPQLASFLFPPSPMCRGWRWLLVVRWAGQCSPGAEAASLKH